jgi:hypothetical protein
MVIFFMVKFGNLYFDNMKRKRDVKEHDGQAIFRYRIGKTINIMLERTVLKTRADRAYVFEFHNGNISLGGLPFLKMTNTYEALNDGASSEMYKREGISFHMFPSFVDAILNRDFVIIDLTDRTPEFSTLVYENCAEHGVVKTLRVKITDIHRRVIGYLGLDYCTDRAMDKSEVVENIKILRDVAKELSGLLSVNIK